VYPAHDGGADAAPAARDEGYFSFERFDHKCFRF
jgi:hypothetical protein